MLHQRQGLALVQLQPFRTVRSLLAGSLRTMGHQGRGGCCVPELCLGGKVQTTAEHNPQRFRIATTAAGEQGVIGANGSTADDHRIASRPQLMHPATGVGTTDPLTGAIGQRGSAIEPHRPLEHPPGATRADAMQKGPVLLCGLLPKHTGDHLNTGLPQLSNPATSHPGIRILQRHHDPGHPGLQNSSGAGRCAAVVAARFQGHDQRATCGGGSSLGQSSHLGMGLTRAGMEPLPHQSALTVEHKSPHKGIGAGATFSQRSQRQGPAHPEVPHQLRGRSCNDRHSPTT